MAAFDYWSGGRPLAPVVGDTTGFDYWLGGRPIDIAAVVNAAASGTRTTVTVTPRSGSATGDASVSGTRTTITILAAVGTASGDATTSGVRTVITITTRIGSAIGGSSIYAPPLRASVRIFPLLQGRIP